MIATVTVGLSLDRQIPLVGASGKARRPVSVTEHHEAFFRCSYARVACSAWYSVRSRSEW